MNTAPTSRRIGELLVAIRDGRLLPNPDFQRRLVWTEVHKRAFIETVLSELPFPEIFVAQGTVDSNTGDSIEWLVDGQQRLVTLASYFEGQRPFDRESDGVPVYQGLSEDEKRRFLQYSVAVRDLGNISLDRVKEIFARINSTGYSLNAMEVNSARYDGALKQFADGILRIAAVPALFVEEEVSFFERHNVFSAMDGRRMNDRAFCLTLVISMMAGYFHRDSEHAIYLEQYNDEFPYAEHLYERIERVAHLLDQQDFSSRSRIWRKPDLLTVMVELDRLIEEVGSSSRVLVAMDFLYRFFGEVDRLEYEVRTGSHIEATPASSAPAVLAYLDAARAGVNDRGNRVRRAEIVRAALDGADFVS